MGVADVVEECVVEIENDLVSTSVVVALVVLEGRSVDETESSRVAVTGPEGEALGVRGSPSVALSETDGEAPRELEFEQRGVTETEIGCVFRLGDNVLVGGGVRVLVGLNVAIRVGVGVRRHVEVADRDCTWERLGDGGNVRVSVIRGVSVDVSDNISDALPIDVDTVSSNVGDFEVGADSVAPVSDELCDTVDQHEGRSTTHELVGLTLTKGDSAARKDPSLIGVRLPSVEHAVMIPPDMAAALPITTTGTFTDKCIILAAFDELIAWLMLMRDKGAALP